jgi:hypothetical protein
LRSDNAAEFVGDVVGCLNAMLEIKHITGSAYHPQSQGQVESMHRTLNTLVRAVVDGHPENWEDALMYAQFDAQVCADGGSGRTIAVRGGDWAEASVSALDSRVCAGRGEIN